MYIYIYNLYILVEKEIKYDKFGFPQNWLSRFWKEMKFTHDIRTKYLNVYISLIENCLL